MKDNWKNEIIAAGFLMAFAFFINRGIEIKGLFMDDLYLWSCYGEQTFSEFVFPMGGTRYRFIYYLAAWIQLAVVGNHIGWFVPCNIIINGLIAYTIYRFGKRLAKNGWIGFLCGIMYLVSRMSYYQIGQVYGLMESMALWAALGIFYCLYCYCGESTPLFSYGKSGEENRLPYLVWANILYFAICFIHERYMVLLPLFYVAFLLKRERKPLRWLSVTAVFGAMQVLRLLTIGTVSPAGTGGTNVADTFSIKTVIKYALSQVLYLFGINTGAGHLSGAGWSESPTYIQLLVIGADLCLAVLVLLFLFKVIKDKEHRASYLRNSCLFLVFMGLCIASSSVTIRVETRWVYVSMTAAWLFAAYLFGAVMEGTGQTEGDSDRPKGTATSSSLSAQSRVPSSAWMGDWISLGYLKKPLICGGLFLLYVILMLPVESYYRGKYTNLYFWSDQLRCNSLAEETYGRYGDELFGKQIYILNDVYEISDFTARTFFKEFDKKRAAEGTKVYFIDSIREIGLVRDNMVILQEEPDKNLYQDITGFVRDLKCERIFGYYTDGWMDESASVRVMAGESGVIRLKLYYPGILTGKERSMISVNGEQAMTVAINSNTVEAEIKAVPGQFANMVFENNFYYEDAAEQRGEKRFSMIMEITAD